MPICGLPVTQKFRGLLTFTLVIILSFSFCHIACAQNNNNGGNNNGGNNNNDSSNYYSRSAVGGVMIDARGVLQNASVDQSGNLQRLLSENAKPITGDMNQSVELRKVSLQRLAKAIEECQKNAKPLPDEIRYLAGLQAVRYVFVYPQQNDIVLAGPGEGWRVDEKGSVVGIHTGRPVLLLDDLLVALRTAREAQQMAISCSIDPTSKGLLRMQKHMKQLQRKYRKTNSLGNPQQAFANIEKVLGPQKITVTVVPPTSHFARVLVAADFRMKRLAMNFEPAPIAGLPSFLQMIVAANNNIKNMLPRWWLEPQYGSLVRDPSGMAWELGDTAVKAMTEADFLTQNGQKKHSGHADPLAQKWADNMTDKYDSLAAADPIFAELQNCMSLAVVGALIAKEDLAQKAGDAMPALMDPAATPIDEFNAPKQVDSRVSALKAGRNWLISASGGVDINSWAALQNVKENDKLDAVRKASLSNGDSWWWN